MRRCHWRRGRIGLVVAVLLLTACAGSTVRHRARTVALESVHLRESGDSLEVRFTGGAEGNLEDSSCFGEYEGEVETAADSITVTVYALKLDNPRGDGCDARGYDRELILDLGEDLGERPVVDGHHGERTTMPVHHVSPALVPLEPPDGWVELRRVADERSVEIAYGPAGWEDEPLLVFTAGLITDHPTLRIDPRVLREDQTKVEIGVRGADSGTYVVTSLVDGSRTFHFEGGGRLHQVAVPATVDDSVAYAFIEGLVG